MTALALRVMHRGCVVAALKNALKQAKSVL